MTRNPFLDPAREIQQGRTDVDILARWDDILRQRAEEAREDAAMRSSQNLYARLSGISMVPSSEGSWVDVAKGIEYAAKHAGENGAAVGRMSLGGIFGDSTAVVGAKEEVFKYAQSKGTIVMAGSNRGDGSKARGAAL